MDAPPKGPIDRALRYVLGFSALAVILVTVVIALPVSALVAAVTLMAVTSALDLVGVDGRGSR